MSHLNPARDEQRPIAHRRDGRDFGELFLVATVEPPVLQSAARASLDHLRDDLSLTCIRQHPWPPIEFENLPVTTQTLADMDADVEVKAHLDVATAIDLPHPANTRLSLNARRCGVAIASS